MSNSTKEEYSAAGTLLAAYPCYSVTSGGASHDRFDTRRSARERPMGPEEAIVSY